MANAHQEPLPAWLPRQVAAFEGLAGATIRGWRGIEEAVRQETPTGPAFTDPAMPGFQVIYLEATMANGEYRTIKPAQNDAFFSLYLTRGEIPATRTWDGIYRERQFALPTGQVDNVSVHVEENTIAEVTISVEGAPLLLAAARVGEGSQQGTLEFHRFDEAVLVFTDPADAQQLSWEPARTS